MKNIYFAILRPGAEIFKCRCKRLFYTLPGDPSEHLEELKVVVHHAVEQQALKRYPGIVSQSEIHSLENLRGIPNELNSDVHLSQIRKLWNEFYRVTPNATSKQLLEHATKIDELLGHSFLPKR